LDPLQDHFTRLLHFKPHWTATPRKTSGRFLNWQPRKGSRLQGLALIATKAVAVSATARAQRFLEALALLHSDVESCQYRAKHFILALPREDIGRWRDITSAVHSAIENAALGILLDNAGQPAVEVKLTPADLAL